MNGRMTARLTRGRPGRALLLALVMCLFWSMTVPLMAVDALPAIGVPSDAYEPDNTALTATVVSVGGAPQPHTLHVATDADWFKLSLKRGTAYSIKTMNTMGDLVLGLYDGVPSAYVKLELYKADGTTLIQEAMPWWPTYTPAIRFKPTATGTYYVRAIVAPMDVRGGAAGSEIADSIAKSYDPVGQYNFSVTLAAPQVVGTVRDADTDEPIAGIPVFADLSDMPTAISSDAACSADRVQALSDEGWTVVAYTDANGDYVIDDMPVGHHHLIFGDDPPWTYGYHSYWYGCINLFSDAETIEADIWLEPWDYSISGTVKDTAGVPLADCDVVAYQYDDGYYYSNHWSWTDEQGVYYFGELPQGYDYIVAANGYQSLYEYGWEYYDETDDWDEAT
ncbi:MAG: carboxypeptidase regulatory-like domain-containing protein, partial [Coriobacteriia bacterium]|nr:carboxypeptidase regulatory-like domain-containing protein [Coriobacteriia bacterium]